MRQEEVGREVDLDKLQRLEQEPVEEEKDLATVLLELAGGAGDTAARLLEVTGVFLDRYEEAEQHYRAVVDAETPGMYSGASANIQD